MKPRKFHAHYGLIIVLFAIAGVLLTACGGGQAQETFTIGVVNYAALLTPYFEGFKAGLAELGYVEGENVTYIYNGVIKPDPQSVAAEIQNLLAQDVDMLFTVGNPSTLAAKEAVEGTDIPVVGAPMGRPVETGVVASLRQPGGNVTGVTNGQGTAKALEWLITITPEAKKIYLPYNPGDEVSASILAGLEKEKASSQLGIELVVDEVHSVEEAVAAIESLPEDVDAIFRIPSPSLEPRNHELSRAAIKRKLPMGATVPMDEAILLLYTVDFFEVGKQAARLADQIFKGIKPADLPVESADYFMTINLKTAEAIGINIPDELLQQANAVIR